MQSTLRGAHLAGAHLSGRFWLRRKTDLKGRSCHCSPDAPLHLVHSEGLREGADVVIDFGSNVSAPGRKQIPVTKVARIAAEIENGDIVHVKSELLGAFLTHVFPKTDAKIVLVTGDSDARVIAAHEH